MSSLSNHVSGFETVFYYCEFNNVRLYVPALPGPCLVLIEILIEIVHRKGLEFMRGEGHVLLEIQFTKLFCSFQTAPSHQKPNSKTDLKHFYLSNTPPELSLVHRCC